MSLANEFKLRQRLLHRIGRRYRVVSETVEIGDLRVCFTRIADPDRVLDQVAAEADLRDRLHGSAAPGDELHLPYWAELWESAQGIGMYLVDGGLARDGEDAETRGHANAANEAERRPSEPALSSARPHVAASSPPAVSVSPPPPGLRVRPSSVPASRPPRLSASLPLSTPSSPNPPVFPPSRPAVLDLGCGMGLSGTIAAALGANVVFADLEPPALLFARLNSLPWRRRVRTRRLNWQRDKLHQRFDLILGADILYERAQWTFLETFWRQHLAPNGKVLLGEPGRQTGEMFLEWITTHGWRLVKTEIPLASRPKPIRVLELTQVGRDTPTL